MKNKEVLSLLLRYSFSILAALGNLYLFYLILTPLTVYSVFFISKLFSNSILVSKDLIFINETGFKIINACVAGSAYYLLLVLNLSTPKIPIKTRIKAILFSFITFFIINIIRILFLILIFPIPELFILTHKIFWYALSTIFVVLIWIAEIRIFKIKAIPFYSDIISLKKDSFLRKKN